MKYYTHQKPPVLGGEHSEKPSETRQSDNMDIKETIARFFRQGGVIPQQLGANDISAEEKEAMFEGTSEQELMDADLVEQKNFIDEVQGQLTPQSDKAEKVAEKEVNTPETEEVKEPTESATAD